ncbi:MAG: hypothetical protein RMJ87_08615 [Cytophagales bacterium]|nr:hypothetical protein [Cytophagales bacterium]
MEKIALQSVMHRIAITGVQPKLSLELEKKPHPTHLTIVGIWGKYILKPPYHRYPHFPEIEDLTMKLATAANIAVVPHCLVYL